MPSGGEYVTHKEVGPEARAGPRIGEGTDKTKTGRMPSRKMNAGGRLSGKDRSGSKSTTVVPGGCQKPRRQGGPEEERELIRLLGRMPSRKNACWR